MKVDLRRHPSGVYVFEVVGPLTADVHESAVAEAGQTPGFEATSPTVWDLQRSDLSELATEELRRIVARAMHLGGRDPGVRVALVVARDVDYGISRMFQALSEDLPQDVQVFRQLDEALAWAAGGPLPAGP